MHPEPLIGAYYLATAARSDEALAADAALLDAAECAKCDGLMFARDRRDFIAGHALVRRTLSRYSPVTETEWAFEVGPYGKPSIVERLRGSPPLVFNLSHTAGAVGCAIGTGVELGVDVESIDRGGNDLMKLAERYFARSEVAQLVEPPAGERCTRFVELWVLKEAYIKAVGRGLSHPLGSFAFELSGQEGLRFIAPPGESAARWQFALFAAGERYRLAIAVGAADGTPSVDFALDDAGPHASSGVLLRRSSR